ncbi:unnamed protein product [Calicophoron daubneyi]|uniref:Lipase n=1 Tax=Calicophoron daubneyi TaxID=300641 RepID=A0AAV2TJL8_CALDB
MGLSYSEFVVFLILLVTVQRSLSLTTEHLLKSKDPELTMNVTEIARMHGYVAEEHFVETADGYILCLFRMYNKPPGSIVPRKVVLLQHGLLDSSHTWINNLRNESLGFILADAGFDVWLANSRGSTYSKRHRSPTADYWKFTWDQMAKYDLPATIYYILNCTRVKKIGFVGHSQGTMTAFARFGMDPELQSHINVFIALAPVAYLKHVTSPIRLLAPVCKWITEAVDVFEHGEFMPSTKLIEFLAEHVCGSKRLSVVCSDVIFLIVGYNPSNLNQTRIPVYISHTPAGTSAQNMVHYCQAFHNNRFQMYDFGEKGNQQHYGRRTPPEYHLHNISIPVAAFFGGADTLSVRQDVEHLLSLIEKVLVKKVYLEDYNHLDFVWGLDSGYRVYPTVLELLLKYGSPQ